MLLLRGAWCCCIKSCGDDNQDSDDLSWTILSAGFETRIDLDVKTRPRELEVKTNAEATGKTARTCRRELAPKPQLCISNVP